MGRRARGVKPSAPPARYPCRHRQVRRRQALNRIFTTIAGHIAALSGKPMTFILALLIVVIWAVTGPMFGFSDVWQLVINTGTTIITFLMVFLVQNTQNRDASAMQAKLDELLRALNGARTEFIGIEHLTDTEIEAIRSALERDKDALPTGNPAHETVERLLSRL